MKSPDRRNLILKSSLALALVATLFVAGLDFLFIQEIKASKTALVFVGLFAGSYFTFRMVVNEFIYQKIKLIYKTIHNLKTPKQELKTMLQENQDVLDSVNKEVVSWAENKQKEIESLKDQEEYRREFLGNVSHELKTPLTLIMSPLKQLLKTKKLDTAETFLIQSAEKNSNQLFELTNQILELTKFDVQKVQAEQTVFDFAELIRMTSASFESLAANQNINFSYDYQGNTPLYILSDDYKVKTIIKNLVSNALKYTNDNGEVVIKAIETETKIIITVQDNGQGIPKSKIADLLESDRLLMDNYDDDDEKKKLGLAIVKRLCALLKHQIMVSSILDKGSVFTLTLPLSSLPVINKKIMPSIRAEDLLKHKSILIIDDEPDVRIAMAAMLEKWGCHVVVADSLAAVFTVLDAHETLPSLILSDYRLAEKQTGLDALIAINKRYSVEVPAILVTGETEINTIRKINDSGYKVLHKPVKPAKLRLTMNGLIDN